MTGLLIGYARVSTEEHDLTAQRDGLATLGVDPSRIFGRRRSLLNPLLAAAAVALSSVFVVSNSLRMRWFRSRRRPLRSGGLVRANGPARAWLLAPVRSCGSDSRGGA